MATPAHPIPAERMQSVQKKQTMLFADANLALLENPSTNAGSRPNVQQNLDRLSSIVLVIRYACSQLNLEHIDSLATVLETDNNLESMMLRAAFMGEHSSNRKTHSDLQIQHQCWPSMAADQGYLGCVLENVEGGM